MKLLLDTHAFIWWDSEPARLSSQALNLCRDRDNQLLLSVASVWEMQIKLQLGKLRLELPWAKVIENQRQTNHVEVIAITHHKDPFDRLLVAQAKVEEATLISKDPIFAQYPIQVQW